MVNHIALSFLLLALVLSPACNRKGAPANSIWKPTILPVFDPQPAPARLDESVLADIVTSVLLNKPETQELSQVNLVAENTIPLHPQFGPFLFSSGDNLIVVADSVSRFSKWSSNLTSGQYTKVYFIALLPSPESEQIILSNEVKEIPFLARPTNSISAQNGKIILTPENMAAALSTFSQWEGVHLDRTKGELTFVGSDAVSNPQISAGDLITAYRAIYEHEAMGEPLFVDMDFSEKKDNYLVTFGGGFEDTRPGRVLYEADLLLKALSSGIDPWSNEKPLVDVMCGEAKQTPVQRIYCKYLWHYWEKKRRADTEVDDLVKEYNRKSFTGSLLARMASAGDAQNAWEYLISADAATMNKVMDEVLSSGCFTHSQGQACVPREDVAVLRRCEDCNKSATYRRIKEIADLTPGEKSIVERAKQLYPPTSIGFSNSPNLPEFLKPYLTQNQLEDDLNQENRQYFTILSFFSPKIYRFLSSCSSVARDKVFTALRKLDDEYGEESGRSQRAKVALLLFMSKEEGFIKDFIALPEDDQQLMAFIASTILDPKFANLLDKLQFHQPLCSEEQGGTKRTKIRDFNTAYSSFVCNYLSRYKRPYLADQIRNDFAGYQSASEIGGRTKMPLNDTMITVRYWFFPGNKVLSLAGPKQLNTFLFNRPNMKAQAERMGRRKGPFEEVDYSLNIPGVEENIKLINDHYDELSEIFPTLKELSNLVRTLAFFRWIRYYQSDVFDLEAFANAVNFGTPTPRTYPVYETVVALPDGSLMRAVGGVDMHSATQVSFDNNKIARFMAAKTAAGGVSTFTADGKKYVLATGICCAMPARLQAQTKGAVLGNKEIKIVKNGVRATFSHTTNGKLDWSWSSDSRQPGSVGNDYYSNPPRRSEWQEGNDTIRFYLYPSANGVIKVQKQGGNSSDHLDLLKRNLSGLGEINAPKEMLWSLFSMSFKDAKMVAKNNEHLYAFKMGEKTAEQFWLGLHDKSGQYVIKEINPKEAQRWLVQPSIDSDKLGSTKITGIQLKSVVPTDSLIITELGFHNDSLLQVSIRDSHEEVKGFSEWRQLTGDKAIPTPWDKEVNIALAPSVFERKKGEYFSNDLTNWNFLIESSASLRGKSASRQKRVAVVRELPYAKRIPTDPWEAFPHRRFVIDLQGFNPESRNKLTTLAAKHSDRVFIFSLEKTSTIQQEMQPGEIIWLSGLTESEIKSRLENAQLKGWFGGVQRIRVFNVNNSVFDLGNNLFVELPQLRSVGAWPRVLNFDSVLPLLEALVESPAGKELDAQITELVEVIQHKYSENGPPQRQQIARDLQEALLSWEELRPLDQSNLSWKNY